eukprot:g15371.t1
MEEKIRNADTIRQELQKAEAELAACDKAFEAKRDEKNKIQESIRECQEKVFWLEKNVVLYRHKEDLEKYTLALSKVDDVKELKKVYEEVHAQQDAGAVKQDAGSPADDHPEAQPNSVHNKGAPILPQAIANVFQEHSTNPPQFNQNHPASNSTQTTLMQKLHQTELQLIQNIAHSLQLHVENRGKIQGSLFQIGVEIQEAAKNLSSTLYYEIDERYRKAIIEEQSVKTAAADCAKYHQSLDMALMKFHQDKMAEINHCMRSLWQEIYKGRDIEYVQIRSDADDGPGGGGADGEGGGGGTTVKRGGAGTRSYNYRLVMMLANGTELDMRGRCSAGQKVLASLITRLALADSFGIQCGILALDEPTTNLDAKNIEALAEALGDLIENRKEHVGFQLMIKGRIDPYLCGDCFDG